ncbi:hypothetical protein ABJB41_24195, partial [Bacteroides ovatus]
YLPVDLSQPSQDVTCTLRESLHFARPFFHFNFPLIIFISLYFSGMPVLFREMQGHWYAISPIS